MKRELGILTGLILLACLVQAWLLAHATLPAPDAVEFVSVAQRLDRDGLTTTLREEPVPPLFPMLVSLAHRVLVGCGAIDASNWGASVQLAAALPLVLCVVPVYLLLKRSVSRGAAIVGTALFALLPEAARLAVDGLSDSTALALFCLATWAAARYFRETDAAQPAPSRPQWLLLAGLFVGLALTARVEAVVIPAAVGLALAIEWGMGSGEWGMKPVRAAGWLALGLALVLVPYLAASDALAPEAAWSRVLGRRAASETLPLNAVAGAAVTATIDPAQPWRLPDGQPFVFGRKDATMSSRFHGLSATLREFVSELTEAFAVVVGLAALYGLWRSRGTGWRRVDVFLTALAVIYTACVFTVALQSGYLAGRHLLPLVVLGLPWAGAGVVGQWGMGSGEWGMTLWRGAPAVAVAAVCLVITLRPVHSNRDYHREAVAWLQLQPDLAGAVLDSAGFTALYSGRKTYRYDAAPMAFIDPALRYVVVESIELAADSERGRSMRQLLSASARQVADFHDPRPGRGAQGVVVFQWQPGISTSSHAQVQGSDYAR